MQETARTELRNLGVAVRKERKRLNLSQEDFAELCDLHRTYVGQIERGEKNISFENILRVSRAFGLKPSKLLAKAKL
jgi:transcriptional regulator with XRE-family HTH domain